MQGKTTLTVRGPETRVTRADCPADAEFLGIMFKFGAFMPILPARMVMDRRDVNLPEVARGSFWLHGSAWQYPNYENADAFVDRLVRHRLLVSDPTVHVVVEDQSATRSLRTVQRRFVQTTGLTFRTARQIVRARYAVALLRRGVSILNVVHEVGYFDQPHLTRSLRHFVGLTPAQITDAARSLPLSFLYKTAAYSWPNMSPARKFESTRSGSAA